MFSCRNSKSVYDRSHFCGTICCCESSHGCRHVPDQVHARLYGLLQLLDPPDHDWFLPASDMLLLGWCSPGSGPLCGTPPLSLGGVVLTLRESEPPVLQTGTAEIWGTCPTSSYTCCSALLCLSPLSLYRTRSFCGPSTR